MAVILALDLGYKRIGLAVSDVLEISVTPMGIIKVENEEQVFKELVEFIQKEKIEAVVIGLPKNMDGTHGFKAQESKAFQEKLKSRVAIKVHLQDERLSTVVATRRLRERNVPLRKRKGMIDTQAAIVILQSFLESRRRR